MPLCQKSIFVVPNHLTDQWAAEFLRLYPSANILVTTKKDFETRNRKKFCARIATGDYDALLDAYTSFREMELTEGERDLTATEKAKVKTECDALTEQCEKEAAICSS